MVAIKGADFTSRSLTGATLKADGYAFACRYVLNAPSGTLDKQMSVAEVKEKSAHGVRIVSNWEWQAVPPNSRATGKDHATKCKAQLTKLGAPDWSPVYYSIDTGANAHDYDAYAQGWRDVFPAERLGVYGDGALFRQLKADGYVTYAWQSMSFSFPGNHNADGRTWNHAGADIIQTGNGTISGHLVDFDTATIEDYGGWLLGEEDPNMTTVDLTNAAEDQIVAKVVAAFINAANRTDATGRALGNALSNLQRGSDGYPVPAPPSSAPGGPGLKPQLDAIAAAIAAISAGGGGAVSLTPADIAAIVKAVNDDAAARMKE